MYCLNNYSNMFADETRMKAYIKALKSVITPDSVLVDLGAGSGILSLIACQLGARKVYAIDPDSSILIGKELAHLNGYEDRIEWIQKDSRKTILKEKADILLSDIRGILPLHEENVSVIIDARNRFLKEGAHLLPLKDTLYAALVEDAKIYKKSVHPWESESFGLDLSPLSKRHANRRVKRIAPKANRLISESKQWAEIDYKTILNPNIENTVTLTCNRDATTHGFYLWFDAEIAPGIGFSGGPGKSPPKVYGNSFFPFPVPLPMKVGDTAEIHIAASLASGEYLWRWNTNIHIKTKKGIDVQSFKQSTFFAEMSDIPQLRKYSQTHTPQINEDGVFEMAALQFMDGKRSIESITRDLITKFPDHFSDHEDCLKRVRNIAEKFSL